MRDRRLIAGFALVLAVLVLGFFGRSQAAPLTTTLSVQPPTQTVNIGDSFTITINASDTTTPTAAVAFELVYDDALLAVTDVTPETWLRLNGRSLLCSDPLFPAAGRMRVACATSSEEAGVTDAGTVATVTFIALSAGMSDLNLVDLSSADLAVPPNALTISGVDGTVTIGAPTAVNVTFVSAETSHLLWIATAILALVWLTLFAMRVQKRNGNRAVVHLILLMAMVVQLFPAPLYASDGAPIKSEEAEIVERKPHPSTGSGEAALLATCNTTNLDCDTDVDEADLSEIIARWDCASADSCYVADFDLDSDGTIDLFDVAWVGNDYDVAPPVLVIASPAPDAVVNSAMVTVDGTVADDHAISSVVVNGVNAAVGGGLFSADIPVTDGTQLISAVATDELGQVSFANLLVSADSAGPEIEVSEPMNRQAVYTLTPEVAIAYDDFNADVDTGTFSAVLTDELGGSSDISADLTIASDGANGTLSTPLTADMGYTLTVSIADTFGNVATSNTTFYVANATIVPPAAPADAGYVAGVVYDSTTCNTHLTTCDGLAGAEITLLKVDLEAVNAVRATQNALYSTKEVSHNPLPHDTLGSATTPVTGTIVTGPDGFFAFPVAETAIYWVLVEKDGYTYAQREIEIVKERTSTANRIYLTPLDSATTLCDSSGCFHQNSDNSVQLDIPAGAIPVGETYPINATLFDHVEFLPSGELPPNTWETYAFNLGGNSEVTFTMPITVRVANTIGFDPGTPIPLGYWNQVTQAWEHAGTGVVDATGNWVEMPVTHFSNYDCNDPLADTGPSSEPDDETEEEDPCGEGEDGCFINIKSGTFEEWIDLPSVNVLGEDVSPQLRYDSSRANPNELIDIKIEIENLFGATIGDYIQWELYIEGALTDQFTFEADFSEIGEIGRFRYWWDGHDAQGNRLPSGAYEYAVRTSIPFEGEYCYALDGIFGNPPDCENGATGIMVSAFRDTWVEGTVLIDNQIDSPFGAGWMLDNQQTLHTDQDGNILITDGRRHDEFYFPTFDVVQTELEAEDLTLAWVNYDSETLQFIPEYLARQWQGNIIDAGREPTQMVLSSDGTRGYVPNHQDDTLSIFSFDPLTETATISVGDQPWDVVLSADNSTAYVTNGNDDTLSIVDLNTNTETGTIAVGNDPSAMARVGTTVYVTNRLSNTLSVVDVVGQVVTATIPVGNDPQDVVISADLTTAYVVNSDDDTVSVIDLGTNTVSATINVGDFPREIALASDGLTAYVTNTNDDTLSVVDLNTNTETSTIATQDRPYGVTLLDDTTAYVTSQFFMQKIDLTSGTLLQQFGLSESFITDDDGPYAVTLSGDGAFGYVPHHFRDHLHVLSFADQANLNSVDTFSNPEDLALTRDGAQAHLIHNSSAFSDSASSLDLPSGDVTGFDIIGRAVRHIALSPDGDRAYVTAVSGDEVSVIDTATTTELTTFGANDPHDVKVAPDGTAIYVTGFDWLQVYDAGDYSLIANIDVGVNPEGVAISADNTFALVANNNDDTISYVDLIGLTETMTLTVGRSPDSISLSPDQTTAYISNTSDDTISVVDMATFTETAIIPVGENPNELVIAGDGNYAYVTVRRGVSVIDLTANKHVAHITNDQTREFNWTYGIDLMQPIDIPIFSRSATDYSTLTYDPASETFTRTMKSGQIIHFNDDGTHDFTLDPDGTRTAYSYNGNGTLDSVAITAPNASTADWVWQFAYVDGKLDAITDPAGRVIDFTVDHNGDLTDVTIPDSGTRAYTYKSDHLLVTFTDAVGNITQHTYDDFGRVTSIIESPRKVYDANTDTTTIAQEIQTFTPSDTGFQLINEAPPSDPNNPAPPVPTSDDLADSVAYGRGSISGATNKFGNWESMTDGEGRTTSYTRDSNNRITRTTLPDGTCIDYAYDEAGNMLSESRLDSAACGGRSAGGALNWVFTYEPQFNQIKTQTDPNGNTTTYFFDYEEGVGNAGNIVRIEYPQVIGQFGIPETPMEHFVYDSLGQVVVMTDTLGTGTRYVYTTGSADEAHDGITPLFIEGVTPVPGLLTQMIEDVGGLNETTTFSQFEGNGNPRLIVGPDGSNTTQFAYDAFGRVISMTDAVSVTTIFVYDAYGRIESQTVDYTPDGITGRNVVTTFAYDDQDRLIERRTAADGLVVGHALSYDTNGQIGTITDGNNNTTTFAYNDADQLESITDPENNTTSFVYRPDGLLRQTIDADGFRIRYQYDEYDRRIGRIRDFGGLNLSETYTLDNNGNMTQFSDANGDVTCIQYDALNRPIRDIRDCGGLNVTTDTIYDLAGNIARRTDPRGVINTFQYDALQRMTQLMQDALGLALPIAYTYDAAGNMDTITDERGVVTAFTYDALNRPLSHCADALGLDLCTTFTYDALGNQDSVTDPNGVVKQMTFNAFELPIEMIEDAGGLHSTSQTVYDDNLNPIAQVDANGNVTTYAYDGRDLLTTETFADTTTMQYTYDGRGNFDVITMQDGSTLDVDFDGANRPITKTYSDGGTQTFTYDGLDRLLTAAQTMSGHTSNLTFGYDGMGSVTSYAQTVDGTTWTTTNTYNYTAGVVNVAYPDGTMRRYTSDPLERLASVTDGGAGTIAAYNYDYVGSQFTLNRDNGLADLFEYDSLYRTTRVSSAVADYRYGYDAASNRTYMQRAHQAGQPADVYVYDDLYQLTQVWYGADATDAGSITTFDSEQTFTLDNNYNRMAVDTDGAVENYGAVDNGQLDNPMNRYDNVGGVAFSYDLRGNLLTDGTNTYTYDLLNRQVTMTNASHNAEYVYDAFGNRVATIIDGVTTYFVYDFNGQVLEERDGANSVIATYTHGHDVDRPLQMTRGGQDYTYHYDALGNVTEITDSAGTLVERYEYDAYGNAIIFDGSDMEITSSAIGNPYLFTGRRFDGESGNYYYRARYYDAGIGRFLQSDPLGYTDGLNTYAYVRNNPTNWRDPLGTTRITGEWISGPGLLSIFGYPAGGSMSTEMNALWVKLYVTATIGGTLRCEECDEEGNKKVTTMGVNLTGNGYFYTIAGTIPEMILSKVLPIKWKAGLQVYKHVNKVEVVQYYTDYYKPAMDKLRGMADQICERGTPFSFELGINLDLPTLIYWGGSDIQTEQQYIDEINEKYYGPTPVA